MLCCSPKINVVFKDFHDCFTAALTYCSFVIFIENHCVTDNNKAINLFLQEAFQILFGLCCAFTTWENLQMDC